METEDLIETIKKINYGQFTTEEVKELIQKQKESDKKAEDELATVKEKVDLDGSLDVIIGNNGLYEIETYRGGYRISFYKGTSYLELIKVYRVKDFPSIGWFEEKLMAVSWSSMRNFI